jgi:hypothetical protein
MQFNALAATLLAAMLAPSLNAIDNATWLASLEGVYMSRNSPTPLGLIGFALDMVKESDGSIHGRTQSDQDTYFDFHFRLNDNGEILFRETGALGTGSVQMHELHVIKTDADTLTFAAIDDPALLVVELTAGGGRLHMKVSVRGREHADLDMARVRDEKWIAKFRADQARAKELPGGSALKNYFAAAASKTVDSKLPVAEQARRHVAESRKLAAQLAKIDPAEAVSLALLMKGHLDRATELDPAYDEAQYALAAWYLQSPELAAKNVERLQEIVTTLKRLHSPLGAQLAKQLGAPNRNQN